MQTGTEGKQHQWIEVLLETPVPDARHRIIGYILAPYLINVKHLEMDAARKVIEDWVKRSALAYEPPWGNIEAFIKRECSKAYASGHQPQDLIHIRNKQKQLFRMIAGIAEAYGLDIEEIVGERERKETRS